MNESCRPLRRCQRQLLKAYVLELPCPCLFNNFRPAIRRDGCSLAHSLRGSVRNAEIGCELAEGGPLIDDFFVRHTGKV